MRIAVLSLTRDRLEYTRHCFGTLRKNAGCEYDHHVLDQGSASDTFKWLGQHRNDFASIICQPHNIGISRGMNMLLDSLEEDYDVIVKLDNDCELTQPNTLRDVCELALEGDALLSPCIHGLRNPPQAQGEFVISGETILDIPQIGGIFLVAPATWYESYRYPESGPIWGLDDANVCHWFRSQGGRCGYVTRLSANHYETTSGQWERYPEYFERTLAEGKPSL